MEKEDKSENTENTEPKNPQQPKKIDILLEKFDSFLESRYCRQLFDVDSATSQWEIRTLKDNALRLVGEMDLMDRIKSAGYPIEVLLIQIRFPTKEEMHSPKAVRVLEHGFSLS